MHGTRELTIPDQLLRALTMVAAFAVVVLLTFVPLSENDFWLQVKIGGMIWNDGKIPETVLFTFTEVKDFPFHAHEWLPSVIFYLLYESLGYENLLFVKGAIGLLIAGLCYRLAYRWTSDFATSLFLAILTMAMINFRFFMRPEIFACLFLIIFLNLLTEYQLTRRPIWLAWMVPLSVVWANSHGTFPISIVIVGLCAAGEGIDAFLAARGLSQRARARKAAVASVPYLICSVALLFATLVNPYGYHLYIFSWDFSRWESTRMYVLEWLPTFSSDVIKTPSFWVYAYGLLLCMAALITIRRRPPAADALLLAVFCYLSADRWRHIVLFAFAALYCVARMLGSLPKRLSGRRLTTGMLLALFGLATGMLIRHGNMYYAYPYFTPSHNFTPELIEYIDRTGIEGNTLSSFSLGAQLIHRYYPRLRPSIDSRIDAYGEHYFYVHQSLWTNEARIREFVDVYDVRYMLLLWKDFNPIKKMPFLKQDGWKMLFADHKMVLMGRGTSSVPSASDSK